jgi:hypothetical protein
MPPSRTALLLVISCFVFLVSAAGDLALRDRDVPFIAPLFWPDDAHNVTIEELIAPYYISGAGLNFIDRGELKYGAGYAFDYLHRGEIPLIHWELKNRTSSFTVEDSPFLPRHIAVIPAVYIVVSVRQFRTLREKQWHAKRTALQAWRLQQEMDGRHRVDYIIEHTHAYNESFIVTQGLHRAKGRTVMYVLHGVLGCNTLKGQDTPILKDGVRYCLLGLEWLDNYVR